MLRHSFYVERNEHIRDMWRSKAYKKTHRTFAAYCKASFGISTSYAYRIIRDERCNKQPISSELRWEIWERDDFRCAYCGARRFLSVDHIKPECAGGTLDKSNLVTACMKCNLKRAAVAAANIRLAEAFLDAALESDLDRSGYASN